MTKKKSKKTDLALRKQIREQEAKKKEAGTTSSEVKVKIVTGDEGESKISFDQWWMMINKKVSLKSWMKEIVLADMGARGLTKSETEEKYNEALRLFGISW